MEEVSTNCPVNRIILGVIGIAVWYLQRKWRIEHCWKGYWWHLCGPEQSCCRHWPLCLAAMLHQGGNLAANGSATTYTSATRETVWRRQVWHLVTCFIPQRVLPFLRKLLWVPHFHREFIWCHKISVKISAHLHTQEFISMETRTPGIQNQKRN